MSNLVNYAIKVIDSWRNRRTFEPVSIGWKEQSAIMAVATENQELRAERDLLQDILDTRPAINAGLPETYIRWSQSIYSGDAIRATLRTRTEGREG